MCVRTYRSATGGALLAGITAAVGALQAVKAVASATATSVVSLFTGAGGAATAAKGTSAAGWPGPSDCGGRLPLPPGAPAVDIAWHPHQPRAAVALANDQIAFFEVRTHMNTCSTHTHMLLLLLTAGFACLHTRAGAQLGARDSANAALLGDGQLAAQAAADRSTHDTAARAMPGPPRTAAEAAAGMRDRQARASGGAGGGGAGDASAAAASAAGSRMAAGGRRGDRGRGLGKQTAAGITKQSSLIHSLILLPTPPCAGVAIDTTNDAPLLKHDFQRDVAALAWQPMAGATLAVACREGVCVWRRKR